MQDNGLEPHQVARRPSPATLGGLAGWGNQATQQHLQRKCNACEQEENEQLQTKRTGDETPTLTAETEALVASLRHGGQPLPSGTRGFFEERMGADFSAVRVHADAHATAATRALRARAYTDGAHIAFGAGEYAPASASGKHLLAHELAHTVQQGQSATPALQRQNGGGGAGGAGGGGGAGGAGGAGARAAHRFSAEGVSVVVRRSCAPANFAFATVEAATRVALDQIFNSDCIEPSRRTRIQRNLTRNGLDIRCRRSANLETPGVCAEATGFFIPANILTVGSMSFAGHPDSSAGCLPLESTLLHEIVHLTRGFAEESLPASCEASCFGVGGGNATLCRDIDVFGRRATGT